ncbi:MAG TPA: tetratricopeptide repeat protein, partial [Myxococcaceae bacterium]|nr:tetratricopeptide repeat protein [Myxococcaceae bacterium]
PAAPTGEVLATPAAVGEAGSGWVAATVRLARTGVMRGDFERGRTLLTSALERPELDPAGKARLQAELAVVLAEEYFYTRQGMDRGLRLAAEAQAAARSLGARELEARAVHAEGFLRYGGLLWEESRDFHLPRELFTRSRDLYRELGERSGVAQETFFLGLTWEQEEKPDRAGPLYEEARALAEQIGDRSTLSYALRHLGGLAESRGDLDQALALQRRSLALREEIGLVRLVPFALIAVGDLERKKGALGDARTSYSRALALAEELNSAPARVWSRFGLGAVEEAEGRLAPALEHYDVARRTAEQLGSKSWIDETSAAAAKVRARLDAGAPATPGNPPRAASGS